MNARDRRADLPCRVQTGGPDRSLRRRALGALICALSGLTLPLASFAQSPPKVWRIGVLHPRSRAALSGRDSYTHFFAGMRDLGYVEGRNIVVQWQFADNRLEQLPELAAQLVKQRVDVIVTNATPAVRAAQQATSTIPIVALTFADPVGSGFAASLARPGGNITGVTNLGGEGIGAKRMEILASVVPNVNRIAYLLNPDNPVGVRGIPGMEIAARRSGKEMVLVKARTAGELSAAFDLLV